MLQLPMNEDYLPLAYLNAWEYCPRRFYLEYVLGEMEENEHIILGQHLHQIIRAEVAPRFIYGGKARANSFAVKLFLV